MDDINIELLNSLNRTQYYQFIRNCLGITVFLGQSNIEVLGELDSKDYRKNDEKQHDRRSFPKELAYYKQAGEIVNTFFVNVDDYDKHTFRDTKGNIYNIEKDFDDLGDCLIWIILTGICKVRR